VTVTAHRKAIDRIRRESRRSDLHREALALTDDSPAEPVGAVVDDRLRLIFTCCHPVLSMESRVALTLRIVGGLTVREIASAFLAQEATMAQRLSRAKAKIAAARIPFRVPDDDDVAERTADVLAVLYLIFNEGYLASGEASDPIRPDLTHEAIRLTRLLRDLLPADGRERDEATGLLALMLLTEARAGGRVTAAGELVTLDRQDRSAWDRALIDEGLALLDDARDEAPGRYRLLSEINAVHVSARRARETDWPRIVALYERLEHVDPSPVVTMNKAIAVSESGSPRAALAVLDGVADALGGHHAFHAARGELLGRAGDADQARRSFDRAIALARNPAEIAHLTRRRSHLAPDTNGEPR
jgi:RNA polymerase sigma-70 factor (ECF subfamily)